MENAIVTAFVTRDAGFDLFVLPEGQFCSVCVAG